MSRLGAVLTQSAYGFTDPDTGHACTICLDNTIQLEALRPLGLTMNDTFICRDCALDDTAAANLAMQCRLKTL